MMSEQINLNLTPWYAKLSKFLKDAKRAPRVLPQQKKYRSASVQKKLDCILCPDSEDMCFEESRVIRLKQIHGNPDMLQARTVLFQTWKGTGPALLKVFNRQSEELQEISLTSLGLTLICCPDPRPEGTRAKLMTEALASSDNLIASKLVFADSNCNVLRLRNLFGPVIVFSATGQNLRVQDLKKLLYNFYGYTLDKSFLEQFWRQLMSEMETHRQSSCETQVQQLTLQQEAPASLEVAVPAQIAPGAVDDNDSSQSATDRAMGEAVTRFLTMPTEVWKEIKKEMKVGNPLTDDLLLHMRHHGFCCSGCQSVGQPVLRCSGCLGSRVRYCSKECQERDWPDHKPVCQGKTSIACCNKHSEQAGGRCNKCGEAASQKCSQCRTVLYCSKLCQTQDWKSHKRDCSTS
eukprot:3157591-Rhodomonas_salina.6